MLSSLRTVFAMMELELRRLKHERTELYTRTVQPILWIAVFGPIMGAVRMVPTGGIPYTDYITLGVLVQSTTFVSIFYGLTIIWENGERQLSEPRDRSSCDSALRYRDVPRGLCEFQEDRRIGHVASTLNRHRTFRRA